MNTPKTRADSSSSSFRSIFTPSRWRYLTYRLLVTFAAYQLCFVIMKRFFAGLLQDSTPPEVWLIYSLIFILVYSVTLYFFTGNLVEDLSIKISNGTIEGPTGVKRNRVSFPIEKLDKAKTGKTGLLNIILQYRHIWSVDGKRIVVYTHSFDQPQLNALFSQIEYLE